MTKFADKVREKQATARASRKPASIPVTVKAGDNDEFARQLEAARRKAEETQRSYAAQTAAANAAREKLQRELDDMRAAQKRASMRQSLVSAAKAAGAVDEEDVADLVLARHRFVASDDGKVLREDDPALDGAATTKAFLDSRPHLVRSQVSPGAGANRFPTTPVAGAPAPSLANDPTGAMRAYVNAIAQPTGAAVPGHERGTQR